MIQGILTGLGFLGAGVILREANKLEIHGLTTAATVLIAATFGITAGLGEWFLTFVGTVMALTLLVFGKPVERFFGRALKGQKERQPFKRRSTARRRPPGDGSHRTLPQPEFLRDGAYRARRRRTPRRHCAPHDRDEYDVWPPQSASRRPVSRQACCTVVPQREPQLNSSGRNWIALLSRRLLANDRPSEPRRIGCAPLHSAMARGRMIFYGSHSRASLPVSDLFPYDMRHECSIGKTRITTDQGPDDR